MGQTDGFAASPLEVRQAAKHSSHLLFKYLISARTLKTYGSTVNSASLSSQSNMISAVECDANNQHITNISFTITSRSY